MTITLKICEDLSEWDSILEKSPHGTLFHTWKFLKIMEKHTKSRLYPLVGLKGTTPIGVYPLFFQKKYFLRLVFSPPPHVAVPYLGPAIADYDKMKQSRKESTFIGLQKKVDEFILDKLKPHYIYLSSPPGLLDSRPFRWTSYKVNMLYDYTLDLRSGKESVWNNMKSSLRNDIKRMRKKRLCVENGSKDELLYIYDSTTKRYEEQGRIATVSKEYLLDVYNEFHPKNLKVFVARYNGENVGGMITINHKRKLYCWVGITKSKLKGIQSNDLVQWEALKWACENGHEYYEMMGAGVERLCRYKSKLNPELSVCFSAVKYPSHISKVMQLVYSNILKPVYTNFRLSRNSNES